MYDVVRAPLLTFKGQFHHLSDGIHNITIMQFDRYLHCLGTKTKITLTNLSHVKIQYSNIFNI